MGPVTSTDLCYLTSADDKDLCLIIKFGAYLVKKNVWGGEGDVGEELV